MLDPLAATAVVRSEWSGMVAVAMRIVGDLGDAEDVAQEALLQATRSWPTDGIPANPGAWLTTVTRRRAINRLRDRSRRPAGSPLDEDTAAAPSAPDDPGGEADLDGYGDDRLRLIVLCCHPALSQDARATLTLRLVSGLSTREIAAAYVTSEATVAQRISRAKATLRTDGGGFVLPAPEQLGPRLDSVLEVIYLLFNEGYGPQSDRRRRAILSREAIALGHQLTRLVPANPEAWGLLALLRFQSSRDRARLDPTGAIIPLDEQDRSRWDRLAITEAEQALASAHNAATGSSPIGRYTLEAEIAARHARAATFAETDWAEIDLLYSVLVEATGNPVTGLNWAIARSYRDGPIAGLDILDQLTDELADYPLAAATRADLLRRADRHEDAAALYRQIEAEAGSEQERSFYARRLAECERAVSEVDQGR